MYRTKTSRLSVRQIVKQTWHTQALIAYMLLVGGHGAEHIIQIIQAFVLNWARADSGGILGLWFPQLMRSEVLHFTYNLLQLLGLLLLYGGFTGRAQKWWKVATLAQGWHFFEHFLLQAQWLTKIYLFGAAKQTSFGELLLARIELHFVYVTLVAIPTIMALIAHFRDTEADVEDEPVRVAPELTP